MLIFSMLKMGIKNKILKRVPKQKSMWISRKNKRENNYDIIFVLNNSKIYHAAIRFKKRQKFGYDVSISATLFT